MREFQSPDMLQ